jgi:uncharacterized protein (TIGR02646 family)
MRLVHKGNEPDSLLKFKRQPTASYEGLPGKLKQEIREHLSQEQGMLCCYCMQRIDPSGNEMKIEHWFPQSASDGRRLELAWKNLFGACDGSQGQPPSSQHCDTRKGDTVIDLSPLDSRCETELGFDGNGRILCRDPKLRREVEEVLNLNAPRLTGNRKQALEGFLEAMTRRNPRGRTAAELQRELKRVRELRGGALLEFSQMFVFWLEKRLGWHGPRAVPRPRAGSGR